MEKKRKPLLYPESGGQIRRYREELGYSQEKLAEKVGVTRRHLGDIETGRRTASLKVFDDLALEFGTPIETLLRNNELTEDARKKAIICLLSRIEGAELKFLHENIKSMLTVMRNFEISSVE